MAFQIIISPEAGDEIRRIVNWYHEQSPPVAEKWYRDVMSAIRTLEYLPERCPISHEHSLPGLPVHQLLFGKKHGQYRIVFEIHRKTVYVLRVYHTARDNNP